MTEVKFVEVSKGYLIRLDDIISVQKIDGQYSRIIICYFYYRNEAKKSVLERCIKPEDDAISYHKLLKYFFDE